MEENTQANTEAEAAASNPVVEGVSNGPAAPVAPAPAETPQPPAPEAPAEITPETQVEGSKEEVSVFTSHGSFVRTYSKEAHGENYAALANQFAAKNNYNVK